MIQYGTCSKLSGIQTHAEHSTVNLYIVLTVYLVFTENGQQQQWVYKKEKTKYRRWWRSATGFVFLLLLKFISLFIIFTFFYLENITANWNQRNLDNCILIPNKCEVHKMGHVAYIGLNNFHLIYSVYFTFFLFHRLFLFNVERNTITICFFLSPHSSLWQSILDYAMYNTGYKTERTSGNLAIKSLQNWTWIWQHISNYKIFPI